MHLRCEGFLVEMLVTAYMNLRPEGGAAGGCLEVGACRKALEPERVNLAAAETLVPGEMHLESEELCMAADKMLLTIEVHLRPEEVPLAATKNLVSSEMHLKPM
jgi:hypothetical protein